MNESDENVEISLVLKTSRYRRQLYLGVSQR